MEISLGREGKGERRRRSTFAMCNRSNILSTIKPLVLFSNWIHCNAFSLKDDKIVVSKFKALASIVFVVFCFTVKYLKLISCKSHPGFEQLFLNVTACLLLMFWLASSLNWLAHGRSIARVWNEMLPLASFINEDTFYRKAFRLTCFHLIGFNATFALYLSMFYYFYPEDFHDAFIYLESFVDYCLLMHFCGMEAFFLSGLYFGTKLLSVANEELTNLRRIEYYSDYKRWKGFDFVKVEKVGKLRSKLKMIRGEDLSPLVDIYVRLCEYHEELNGCFGVSLTASCLNNLMQMTFSCYFMTKHGWAAVRMFSVWLFYFFMFEWKLVQACENFTKEIKRTGRIIDLVVTDGSSQVLKSAVDGFSRHLLHRPVKFTACKLFDLNYQLLYSVVTNIITYLVIVMQLDDSQQFNVI